jgi:hypothetical protein
MGKNDDKNGDEVGGGPKCGKRSAFDVIKRLRSSFKENVGN